MKKEYEPQPLKWAVFMVLFGTGMVGLSILFIRQGQVDMHQIALAVTAGLLAVSSFILGIIEFFDYLRQRKQIMADLSCYSEYKRQQPVDTIKLDRYMRHIFTEHSKSMFGEIYWNQVEAPMTLGWIVVLICGVCVWVTRYYLFYLLIIFFGVFMFSGFWGTACRRIRQQIRNKNLDMEQVTRDYRKGVVYLFGSGYFNICPNYTFLIRGKETAVMKNEELLRISGDFKKIEQTHMGVPVGTMNGYTVSIATKDREVYTVTCEIAVGTLVIEAVNRKIQECRETSRIN